MVATLIGRGNYAPGLPCPDCGRRHKTWLAVARCHWREGLLWVNGNPPSHGDCYAVVSMCPHAGTGDNVTVTLWENRQDAEKAKAMIDRTACGGRCFGPPMHRLYAMEASR
jgi:hypothetical protein